VQSTAAPSTALGLVTIHDTAPATDQFNYAAVELVAAPVAPLQSGFAATARFRVAGVSFGAPQGHAALTVSGLCPLGAVTGLPPAADVLAAAARRSPLRRAGRRAVGPANRGRFKRNHPRAGRS
jgi:hypothetical protein